MSFDNIESKMKELETKIYQSLDEVRLIVEKKETIETLRDDIKETLQILNDYQNQINTIYHIMYLLILMILFMFYVQIKNLKKKKKIKKY